MCGIVGFNSCARIFTEKHLEDSLSLLGHRGPDDNGIFINSDCNLGLAHTRLSILDLTEYGHQPMCSDDHKICLVFNGEIYNYKSLKKDLVSNGVVFSGDSDTEVILKLYLYTKDNGKDITYLLKQLNGIFALAIWDHSLDQLLLARDGLGVKPLYVVDDNGYFLFSSEIKALVPMMSQEDGGIDIASIDRYLTYLWCPGEGTPFSSVKKMNPGEVLLVSGGKIVEKFIWYKLPFFKDYSSKKMYETKDTVVLRTEDYLRQAVHRQMVADVPVGAFLSGGLDSSSVVAFAKELNPDIQCFTIEQCGGSEDGMTDDLPYAKKVAQHLNVPLQVVTIDSKQMAMDLEYMVYQLDEPLADLAPLNVFYISKLARQNGMKVLLSGSGGDDLFTGYRRHSAVLADRYIQYFPQKLRIGIQSLTSRLDQRNPLWRRLYKYFNGVTLTGDDRLVNYFSWCNRADLQALYSQQFRASLGDTQASSPMLDFLGEILPAVSPLERMLALEQRFFLTDHNLLYTDKMSMAAGVEVRVPFLDYDLVEFAAQIPNKFKQRGPEGKWVLKKAMEAYLPHDVIYRSKSGFGVPLRRWMRYELRELLGDLLSVDSLRRRGLFNPSAVQQLISNNDAGKIDASYTLLSLLCIEIWCRHFLDNGYKAQIRRV